MGASRGARQASLGRERLHSCGRHARRGRDRQCLRIHLRIAADRHPAASVPGRSRRSRTSPSAPRTWPPARSRPRHPGLGQALQHTAASAFLRGLTISCLVAAGCRRGALLAVCSCRPAAAPAPMKPKQPNSPQRSTGMTDRSPRPRHRIHSRRRRAGLAPTATTITLATRLAAARADGEGYRYFSELADAQPGEALPLTLAGSSRPAGRGCGRRAGQAGPGRATDLGRRSTSAAGPGRLPPDRERAASAIADLEFVLAVRDQFRPCCCGRCTTASPPPMPCWPG